MRPTRKRTDDKEHPRPGDERRSVKQWAIVGMLLVTSAVPCPECGGPLALHIWPLIALILVARGVAGRARPAMNAKCQTNLAIPPPKHHWNKCTKELN